jgi:hypothetical protein
MKYSIGHPAYAKNSVNSYSTCNTIHGVYVELWERGVAPRDAAAACESVLKGKFTTVHAGKRGVIECQMVQ